MSERDRIKWDDRYRKDQGASDPSWLLTRFGRLAPVGTALDIACGNGRNSAYLADRGFAVDAVDISWVATRQLSDRHPQITVIQADLDTWTLPERRYELVANIRYLGRRLFPMILKSLKPGGVLIFEAFVGEAVARYSLRPDELPRAFQTLQVIHYEERKLDRSEKFDAIAEFVGVKQS